MSLMWGQAAVICPLAYGLIGGIRLPDAAHRHSGWITRLGRTNMRQNALLRSGKGLATPSTARKNVAHVAVVKCDSAEGRERHFAVRHAVRCARGHLIVDLHWAGDLDDLWLIQATLPGCEEAVEAALMDSHPSAFSRSGVSGVAVLAESHISIHTWPDSRYAALDVFMCGKAIPEACIPVLRKAFKAKRVEV